ncbi:MAG: hypothetical protein JWM77_3153 [Rhodospirillales bacterium]|nr:hypothetical protein [Rhodospirillales bacterium]
MNDLILALAAAIAGAVNAVAGGGTFVTFPALTEIALVLPVVANATNTVALFPGNFASAWAYRKDLSKPEGVSVWLLLVIAIIGSVFGAWLVTITSDATFLKVVPWLLLFATVLFALGGRIARWLQAHARLAPWWLAVGMVPVAIYGGYFGAAMGIVQLALFAVVGMTDLNRMNALKTIFTGICNMTAVIIFVAKDFVAWRPAMIMAVGAVIGGYWCARWARRLNPLLLRRSIIVIGLVTSAYYFMKAG